MSCSWANPSKLSWKSTTMEHTRSILSYVLHAWHLMIRITLTTFLNLNYFIVHLWMSSRALIFTLKHLWIGVFRRIWYFGMYSKNIHMNIYLSCVTVCYLAAIQAVQLFVQDISRFKHKKSQVRWRHTVLPLHLWLLLKISFGDNCSKYECSCSSRMTFCVLFQDDSTTSELRLRWKMLTTVNLSNKLSVLVEYLNYEMSLYVTAKSK